ncbi:hypothetical protein APR12_003744 [Nocardia amikacinitolerans]|uniref:hypothetical protein n=1 Tax=Nocardia amikacinitolerans TaxID=756689 RepID=UPI000AC2EBC8|nr:hypothetical protein [Nocardia amikacinitolerans]MCP2318391.1 hypothetical protein [Nocardia amikacinitolerans]
MQTLIVVGVVVVVLFLVFAVVQFASRPPRMESRWDDSVPVDKGRWGDGDD